MKGHTVMHICNSLCGEREKRLLRGSSKAIIARRMEKSGEYK